MYCYGTARSFPQLANTKAIQHFVSLLHRLSQRRAMLSRPDLSKVTLAGRGQSKYTCDVEERRTKVVSHICHHAIVAVTDG